MTNDVSSFLANVDKKLKSSNNFAVDYVNARLDFFRKFNPGYICSTSHGVDYFDNLRNCLAGDSWTEKGEYGDNFRKLIKHLMSMKHNSPTKREEEIENLKCKGK